jgi:CheY-like chemotaxis protein
MVHALGTDWIGRFERRRFTKPIAILLDGDMERCEESALALEEGGYHVLTAVNAAQGIVLVMTRAPAVIVADISSPRAEGWTLCEAVRSHLPSPAPSRLLLLAGSNPPDHTTRLRGLRLGAVIRTTPDDPHQLATIVGKVLAEPIE